MIRVASRGANFDRARIILVKLLLQLGARGGAARLTLIEYGDRQRYGRPRLPFSVIAFANAAGCERISPLMQASECTDTDLVSSHGDWLWEMRRTMVRLFPVALITQLSKTSYPLQLKLKDWQMARAGRRAQ